MDSDRELRDTLVQRLNVEITALTRMTATTLPDDEMNRRLDELFTAAGRHLREHLDPDDRGAVLP